MVNQKIISLKVGRTDRVPDVAVADLPLGRGLPRLPDAQLHHQADLRRRISRGYHFHLDGSAADRSFLQVGLISKKLDHVQVSLKIIFTENSFGEK